MNRLRSSLVLCGLCIAAITQFAPPAMSQANVTGQWQTLPYVMPVNPVHVTLLHTGKVLVVQGSGNYPPNKNFQAAIWDPQAGTITVQSLGWDMFCNGMVTLPDGRALIAGGTLTYSPPQFTGLNRAAIYDPATGTFLDQPNMAHGRWYPTLTTLPNGSVMVFSGLSETGPTNSTYEIFSAGSGWSAAFAAPFTPPLYPRMHVLPNGTVFNSAPSPSSNIYNPATNSWQMNVAATNYGGQRIYGSSVLLPLTPANGYDPRVIILGGGLPTTPATATTEIIDLGVPSPKWVYGPSMSAPRMEMDATLLPNGKILALGGSKNDEDATTAALNADLYDPTANTFSPAGTEAFARLYHTVSLLMPDGTVWVAGGNPAQGTYEPHMEIYSPAYLFNPNGSPATRPSIANVSTTEIGYGGAFQVQTPDAANISTVVLMRNGSSTHAFDMDQRYVGLSYTTGSGVLNVTGPPNSNIAPPGYYMLFILNSAGVPSVASMVHVSANPTATPPTGTITSPASNVSIGPGQSVSFAGSGTAPDGSISSYFWSFPGGNPSSSQLANPGNITYSTPGTYVAQLTVTDNLGVTDPHPPTRTITVADFSIGLSPGLNSVSPGSTATSTVTVTSGTGFVGNITFSVSGLPNGTSATFSPPSVANSGSSTMSVSTSNSTATGSYSLKVTATSGSVSHSAQFLLLVASSSGTAVINFGSGFSATGMQLNGSAKLVGTALQLTDTTTTFEAGSAYWTTPVNVQKFSNNFTFQLTNPNSDGFTFVLQNTGLTAVGADGGGLGYAGVGKSVAVKFDLYNNAGEGNNSTGLYTKGFAPTVPATTLGGGINLHSGDVMQASMTYDGTTLTMTITDTTAAASFTTSWPVNIPTAVGGNTAYAGFTGATGGGTATQQILAWTYSTGTTTATATPVISPATGTYAAPQTVTITDSGAVIYYTLDGTTPTTSSTKYGGSFVVSATTTVNAIAVAPGLATSAMATSVISIQTPTPVIAPATGTYTTAQTVTITDSGAVIYYTLDGTTPTTSSTKYGGSFVVSATTTVHAIAVAPGLSTSAMATSVITIQGTTPTPVIAPATGTYTTAQTVTITDSGAVIYYTLDGTTPTTSSTKYGGSFVVSATTTVHAIAVAPGLSTSAMATSVITIQGTTPTPVIAPATGTYTTAQTVTITDSGAVIYYTLDGTTPTTSSTKYGGSFVVSATTTVNAIAVAPGLATSAMATSVITIQGTTPTPVIAPATGTYTTAQTVTITDSGAVIYYTLDGTTPTTSSTKYGGSFVVSATTTVHAIAVAPGLSTSAMATSVITIQGTTPTPVIAPATGTYTTAQTVTITDSGAVIYYTLDGTTPTTSSTKYGGSFVVSATTTVNAIAVAPGLATSAMATSVITIQGTTPTPVIAPATGTYTTAQTVTITDSGAVIYYTLDGTTPTTSSTKYGGSFVVSATTTVHAIAVAPGLSTSAMATSVITIQGSGTAVINFGSGFSAAGMQLNGNAKLNGTAVQLTDTTTTFETGSAYWTTPVNVQQFSNTFTFQLTNANADGFTFVLQNAGLTAMGATGGGLGYAGMATSVAVKFDLYSNAGEGINSTGLYIDGNAPTVPATTLGGGINLHSGDVMQASMTYDGTTLTMTITDATAGASFTASWPVNIPAAVGGNTAYAGFTGATGGGTATQQILAWTYNTNTTTSATATPVISPATGTYAAPQTVTITDSGAVIYYTLDGTTPTTSSTKYGGSFVVSATTTVNAIAVAPGLTTSAMATSVITIQSATTEINFGSGFSAAGMQLNGNAKLNGTALQLTDTTTTFETGSAYWTTLVNAQSFTNTFTFQLTNANADGFTFVLQNAGLTAMGATGGGLGYAGMATSVAVKFDLYSNAGEGINSTGLYIDGNAPTVPATTLGGGINLHSGDVMQASMTYDGTTLTMIITDATTGASFTTSWPVNIPGIVGNTAYAGFTGATGGGTATQQILTWTYTH